jgi:formylglycine-generating enzyme required for sulfatase activity
MGDTFGDGEEDELPTHQVTVSDFYIGIYPVTQGEWQTVMGSNPSHFTDGGASLPVEQVSWDDVQIFISNLNQRSGKNYRLPTEAEWEYAARSGGKSEKYSGGNDINAVAWYGDNYGGMTYPVGQKQPNGLGLYDMCGNVLELVSDWYGSYSSYSQTNPVGPLSGTRRVLRGGSFGSHAAYARVAVRSGANPGTRYYNIGFRLASPVQ